MVEVFKTDVKCPFVAQQIIADLLAYFVHVEVSFDLEDIDCILRLSSEKAFDNLEADVCEIVKNNGCFVEVLTNDFLCAPASYFLNVMDSNKSINGILSIF